LAQAECLWYGQAGRNPTSARQIGSSHRLNACSTGGAGIGGGSGGKARQRRGSRDEINFALTGEGLRGWVARGEIAQEGGAG